MFKIKVKLSWKTKDGGTQTQNVEFCDEWKQPAKAPNGNIPVISHKPINSIEQYENLIYGYPSSVKNYIKRAFEGYENAEISVVNMHLESKIREDSIESIKLYEIPSKPDEYIVKALVESSDNSNNVKEVSIGKLVCTLDKQVLTISVIDKQLKNTITC